MCSRRSSTCSSSLVSKQASPCLSRVYLWNLGDSKNTLRKLADLRDDVELFELADDVGGALQLADQYTCAHALHPFAACTSLTAAIPPHTADDNVFIKFQPGSGKVLIKEPKSQLKLASDKLKVLLGK
jgi:hypothetical protein